MVLRLLFSNGFVSHCFPDFTLSFTASDDILSLLPTLKIAFEVFSSIEFFLYSLCSLIIQIKDEKVV